MARLNLANPITRLGRDGGNSRRHIFDDDDHVEEKQTRKERQKSPATISTERKKKIGASKKTLFDEEEEAPELSVRKKKNTWMDLKATTMTSEETSSIRRSPSKQKQSQNRPLSLKKKDRNAGGNFEIFSEEGNDNDVNDESGSENEGSETEKKRPLSLVEVNSLLFPTSKAGGRDGDRDRETDNRPQKEFCDKENLLDDEAEETDHDEEEEEEEEEEESTRRGSTTDNFLELEAEETDNDEEEEEEDEEEDTRRALNRSLRQPTSARKMTTRETPKSTSNNNKKGKQFSQYRQPPAEIEETDEEEENESEDDGFDSLDDFIVSDNEEISYYDTSDALDDDDDDEEEDEIKEPPPQPKPRRRLIRGRRPRSPEEKEPERREEKLEDSNNNKSTDRNSKERQFRLEPSLPKALDLSSPPKLGSKPTSSLFQTQQRSPRKMEQHSDDNDDLFQHNSSSSESDSPKKKKMATQDNTDLLVTPPASPSRPRLQSPSKDKHRIPPSPHRESIDEFWSQEVITDWNDQYSPRKDLAAPGRAMQRLLHALGETTTDESNNNSTESTPSSSSSPGKKDPKTPSKTALKKAEAEKKRALLAKKKEFDNKKASFAEEFLKTLDDAVAGGQVQKLAEETGGVKIIWSKTLQTTAGRAKWKREKFSSGSSNSSRDSSSSFSSSHSGEQTTTTATTKIKHHATIELAERIIDCEDRLLNTLAHEYCHLANYMISNIRNNPHGASFKEWAAKCSAALRDHPIYGGGRIEVTTKHSYKIDYKYVWLCVDCGQEYGRHSKSINPDKVRCGLCKGVLQQVKPKPRNVSPRKADNQNNFNKGPVGQKVEEVMRGIGEVSLRG